MKLISKALWFRCFGAEVQREIAINAIWLTAGWKVFFFQVSEQTSPKASLTRSSATSWSETFPQVHGPGATTRSWMWYPEEKREEVMVVSSLLLLTDQTANVWLTSVLAARQPPIEWESFAVTERRAALSHQAREHVDNTTLWQAFHQEGATFLMTGGGKSLLLDSRFISLRKDTYRK